MPLRALARVNLAAVERNVARLRQELRDGAELCAVVKADGYGHGAVAVARAAIAGGATRLAVATAEEAAELRAEGIEHPVMVMGALSSEELPVALQARAEVVVWSKPFLSALEASGVDSVPVHVKLDSGMGRLGTRDSELALSLAERAASPSSPLDLVGVMTHLATADEDLEFVRLQLTRFRQFADEARRRWPSALVHAANSAATLNEPSSHFDLVRCGIGIYGCDPMHEDPANHGLEPALALTSYVAAVKLARRGDSVGYGRRFVAEEDTWIATLPIGYADGIRRALSGRCEVLVSGRRYSLVGTISMDNIALALGGEHPVREGDLATIIGVDGTERQTAEDLAAAIGTINYEILCGISPRVPRIYHRDGEAV